MFFDNDLKVIIPMVITDKNNLKQLQNALPASKFMVCELSAPAEVLKSRTDAGEPNEYWQKRLCNLVDSYHASNDLQEIADFQVSTYDRSIKDVMTEVLEKAAWQV